MRKFLAVLLALLLMLSLFAGCNTPDNPNPDNPNPDNPSNPSTPGDDDGYKGQMVENGNTYADPNWLPVVKKPITVSAMVRDPLITGNTYQDRTIWKEFADTTGVTLDLQVTVAAEPENLMFASRNYPDIAFRLYVDNVQLEACYNGDIIELTEDMLTTYAPNWYELFTDYPEIYKMTLAPDGKLYSLPEMIMDESNYMLRDLHAINETWLDELGLEIPTTVDGYTEYLRAVKNARGTGSIPENAVPLYIRLINANIGGYFNILDWYGVYQGFDYEIIHNGKVENNAQNKNVIPALKYVAQLWSEGLINEDAFVGDWTKYTDAMGANYDAVDTPFVGSYFGFAVYEGYKDDYVAISPLDAGTDEGPYSREFGMDRRIIPKALSIFKTSQYPIAILRAFDHYATGEGALRAVVGEEDVRWFKTEDGEYRYTDIDNTNNTNSMGWNDTAPGIITPDIVEQLITPLDGEVDMDDRTWQYPNLYKDYLPEDKSMYPKQALNYLTTDEYTEAELIRDQIRRLINSYTAKWFKGTTSIEDEWDDFQEKLGNIGIERRLELLQKAYDKYQESGLE